MSSPPKPRGPVGAWDDREAAIVAHVGLARALARRYANRGEPLDDLEQVAMVGLINAVDRFDPSKGAEFRSFAAPTILGELRRHFRDRAWAMRVPRGLKDDYARVTAAVEALTARLGRTPGVAEIAAEAGIGDEQVLDAIAAHGAYRPQSLSAPPPGDEEGVPTDVATEEEGYARVEGRAVLAQGLRHLPARERVILHLRFEEGLSQSDIGRRLGISQMHVSRLLARALATLRRVAQEGGT